jgi:hypothetical protein
MLSGYVAGDLGKADDLPVHLYRVDHHHCPELATVFPYPPAFRCEASGFHGGAQGLLGDACLAILGGIEAGKMLADNLVGQIALGPFGARVPADDAPFAVQHENGIVDDRLDQALVSALVHSFAGRTLTAFLIWHGISIYEA